MTTTRAVLILFGIASSVPWSVTATAFVHPSTRHCPKTLFASAKEDTSKAAAAAAAAAAASPKGVAVTFRQSYRELDPILISTPPPVVQADDEAVQALVQSLLQEFDLVPVIDFVTRGGVQWGDVVVCDWKSIAYLGGGGDGASQWQVGSPMAGLNKVDQEIAITTDQREPLATFARQLVGSGQMQTSTFEAEFPSNHPSPLLQGAKSRFSVVVKKILKKVPKNAVPTADAALSQALETIQKERNQAHLDVIDEHIQKAVMGIADVQTEDVVNSVSWAKFGEKSLAAFSWNCVREKIAALEGIDARQVEGFLRDICTIQYVSP